MILHSRLTIVQFVQDYLREKQRSICSFFRKIKKSSTTKIESEYNYSSILYWLDISILIYIQDKKQRQTVDYIADNMKVTNHYL
jgi:hypothetical protein